MINKFSYLNKRDNKGRSLKISSFQITYEMSEFALNKLKKTKTYNQIINVVPEKYINIFLMKLFTEELISIAAKININNCDLENKFSNINKKIFLDKYYFELLNDFKSINNFNIYKENIIILILRITKIFIRTFNHFRFSIVENCISYYYDFLSFINFKKPTLKFSKKMIAVNYVEGLNENKRSDLFWLEKSEVRNDNILIYFENRHAMNRHNNANYNAADYIYKKKFHSTKIWQFREKINFYDLQVLCKKLQENISYDLKEIFLQKIFLQISKRINYWYSFFYLHNVKLHFDPIEFGTDSIAKQIALHSLNGCSIGKERSYIGALDYMFVGYYPNNIFFTWGSYGKTNINKKQFNIFDTVNISGYPYKLNTQNNIEEIKKIKLDFKKKGVSFILLLLDSNFGLNNNLVQAIDHNYLYNFYFKFIEWLNLDQELGIIIKSKKSKFFKKFAKLDQLINTSINTGRCYVVEDSFQTIPSQYAKIADFSIGVSTWFSSALLECVAHDCKGIFLDYANIRNDEIDLLNNGDNKIVFSNIDKMILELKNYKNNPSKFNKLGNWSHNINLIDPYRDSRGFERIGKYIDLLHNEYEKDLPYKSVIKNANQQFLKLDIGKNNINDD